MPRLPQACYSIPVGEIEWLSPKGAVVGKARPLRQIRSVDMIVYRLNFLSPASPTTPKPQIPNSDSQTNPRPPESKRKKPLRMFFHSLLPLNVLRAVFIPFYSVFRFFNSGYFKDNLQSTVKKLPHIETRITVDSLGQRPGIVTSDIVHHLPQNLPLLIPQFPEPFIGSQKPGYFPVPK
jgi:hypothetical protein